MLTARQRRLVEAELDLVPRVVSRVLRRRPANYLRDELTSAAYEGLVQAAERYRPSAGAFRPFAEFRVQGAVLDELRAHDPAGRYVRDQIKAGREDLIPRVLVQSHGELEGLRAAPMGERRRDPTRARFPEVVSTLPTPEDEATRRELGLLLSTLVGALTPREQVVVGEIARGMPLAVIAEALGCTESRACQIWMQAARKLREALGSAR